MRTKEKTISSACVTSCKISTNVPCGGDSGHGGLTTITFVDLSSTDMSVDVGTDATSPEKFEFDNVRDVTLRFGGDCEARNVVELLRFAAFHLEEMIDQNESDKANREFSDLLESEDT